MIDPRQGAPALYATARLIKIIAVHPVHKLVSNEYDGRSVQAYLVEPSDWHELERWYTKHRGSSNYKVYRNEVERPVIARAGNYMDLIADAKWLVR